MLNYLKMDYGRTKKAWEYIFKREISNMMYLPMYIVLAILALPFIPIAWLFVLGRKLIIKRLMRRGF